MALKKKIPKKTNKKMKVTKKKTTKIKIKKPVITLVENTPEPITQVPKKEVDLVTSDGVQIKGDFFDDMKTEKGAILLPMLGRTKETMSDLASFLHPNGYKCLAIDPRGHGKSQQNWQSFTSRDFNNIINDIRAAKDYLSAHGSKNVSIIGASIGANLALNYASIDSEVKTVVLLSPGLDFRGVRTQQSAGEMKKPFLIIVSKEDTYSYQSSIQLDRLSGAEGTRLDIFEGLGHGTEMFKDKKVLKIIKDWLNSHV